MNLGIINRDAVSAATGNSARGGASVEKPASNNAAADLPGLSSATNQSASTGSLGSQSAPPRLEVEQLDRASIEKLAQQIGEHIRIENRALSFSVDEELGKTIVKVMDRETDEVIRQIPSEELLRFARVIRMINEQRGSAPNASGLLISEQA